MSAPVGTSPKAPEALESPGCLAENLGWLLSHAHYALATEVSVALAPLGISGRSHQVLAAALSGEHTQTELARLVGLDKTTMVVTMDELERLGLAERRPSKTDRRARAIVVTAKGRRMVERGQELIEGIQEDVLATLPDRDRAAFLRALGSLVKNRFGEHIECAPQRRREPKPR
jgi:MarR family transcriptional regulator, transcriptional regulator for hemolysin